MAHHAGLPASGHDHLTGLKSRSRRPGGRRMTTVATLLEMIAVLEDSSRVSEGVKILAKLRLGRRDVDV
jgi:hypothetical protein